MEIFFKLNNDCVGYEELAESLKVQLDTYETVKYSDKGVMYINTDSSDIKGMSDVIISLVYKLRIPISMSPNRCQIEFRERKYKTYVRMNRKPKYLN